MPLAFQFLFLNATYTFARHKTRLTAEVTWYRSRKASRASEPQIGGLAGMSRSCQQPSFEQTHSAEP